MAIPLFIGYVTNNSSLGNFGSLGIFTFLYYKRLPIKKLIIYLSSIGLFLLFGNFVGILSSYILWLIPISIAFISLFARIFCIEKPGAFFIVIVTSMGTGTNIPLSRLPLMIVYVFLGIIVSLLVATVIFYINRKKDLPTTLSLSWKERLYNDPGALLDAVHYATILFLASYISQSCQTTVFS